MDKHYSAVGDSRNTLTGTQEQRMQLLSSLRSLLISDVVISNQWLLLLYRNEMTLVTASCVLYEAVF